MCMSSVSAVSCLGIQTQPSSVPHNYRKVTRFFAHALDRDQKADLAYITALPNSSHLRGCIQKFPDWVITKYTLTTINTHWKATQMIMAAKLTRLTHKIAIQLHIVAESCTICSSRSRRPVRKLLDTPSCLEMRWSWSFSVEGNYIPSRTCQTFLPPFWYGFSWQIWNIGVKHCTNTESLWFTFIYTHFVMVICHTHHFPLGLFLYAGVAKRSVGCVGFFNCFSITMFAFVKLELILHYIRVQIGYNWTEVV
jgi:hypothetical protein